MHGPRAQVSAMLPIARLIVSSAVEVLTATVDTRSRENARVNVAELQEGNAPQV
jgi:hypothetical protein